MLERKPIAAGRFYSGTRNELIKEVTHYLGKKEKSEKPWGVMLPHAGYIYCGEVIGSTLKNAELPKRLIILCPNHTGKGTILSVWPAGEWVTPLGEVKVDNLLVEEILATQGGFSKDCMAHLGEHSIEVLLPFIQILQKNIHIVPICVGTQNPQALRRAGFALASVLKMPENKDVGLLISSDMNHYENQKTTLVKDDMALQAALKGDPDELLKVVNNNKISMCGAAPLALALYTAKNLGNLKVDLVAHSTSGNVSGDFEHVVGYAGLQIFLN